MHELPFIMLPTSVKTRDKCLHLYSAHSSRSNYLLISILRPFTIQFLWNKLMKEVQYDHSIFRGRLTNWITHLINQAPRSSFRFYSKTQMDFISQTSHIVLYWVAHIGRFLPSAFSSCACVHDKKNNHVFKGGLRSKQVTRKVFQLKTLETIPCISVPPFTPSRTGDSGCA